MNFQAYVKAGYSLLWVQTPEENRVIETLSAKVPAYQCFKWDLVTGLSTCSGKLVEEITDPISFLQALPGLEEKSIVFAMDFHKFFQDITVIRQCKSILGELRARNRHIIFVSHSLEIPPEMEKDITVFDFEMPSLEALVETATNLRDQNELEIEVDPKVISAAKGLTQIEAENAFARSIIETGKYTRAILDQEKLQAVRKSGLMEIWNPEPIENVGGLDVLKRYIYNRQKGFYNDLLPTPKGILLAGLPGSGKSLSAKAIASVLDVPLIRLDLGTLKGGLVGESEANMKKATQLIDAIGDCVVWLDEVEKALSGVASSGKTDGGTGSNMFGQLLTWMQESKENHYVVATCNDIDDLLSLSQGAFIRRFDDIFFVDLPGENEVAAILDIMCKRYKADIQIDTKRLVGYTGAEIEKIVKSSLYDGLEVALSQVKPISVQNKDVIEKARKWASNNAILANEQKAPGKSGRKLG
jgi:hypothetical protein